MSLKNEHFISFESPIEGIPLPERFTFPFYYEPHPLCLIAAEELQAHLKSQTDWEHNFGLEEGQDGMIIGKMFGVLVVENETGELGYLAAFSGKLADANHHPRFVPPVFDMLTEDGFFNEGMLELNAMTEVINDLQKSESLSKAKENFLSVKDAALKAMEKLRLEKVEAKRQRKIRRLKAQEELDQDAFDTFNQSLINESLQLKYEFSQANKSWNSKIHQAQQIEDALLDEIRERKRERKAASGRLQKRLFDNYQFLNILGESKSVLDIFDKTHGKQPPSGSGECAAPKLLNYAFNHNLRPICMAEFWWGSSPSSEIRKHGFFYPACRGKCEPILSHMLIGMEIDDNPIVLPPELENEIEIIYEDEYFAVINKPSEFLSVPGKTIEDCVHKRMKELYPEADGPLIVHRLDMSTSGIMLIAKTKEANKELQRQFIEREVKKSYIAVLEGILTDDEGVIDLPLRVDLEDRPRQLVCYEHGKPAKTKYKVISRQHGRTRIHFYPITGRTHQLRVHAAHVKGLNIPIVGDDLYGSKDKRLYLHAESIEFKHPMSKQELCFKIDPEF